MKKPFIRILIFGVLFAIVLLIVFGPKLPSQHDRRIIIGDAEFAYLLASWQRTWQRQPTKEEFSGLLQSYIKDEVTYQEALKQGIDKNNAMVKRAVIMQMDILASTQNQQKNISEEDIKAFYTLRQDKYLKPAKFSFTQLYFSKDLHPESLEAYAKNIIANLNSKSLSPEDGLKFGDPILLENTYSNYDTFQVDRNFGTGFSKKLEGLPQGEWVGPIASTYGLHAIYITEYTPPALLPLDLVKGDIVDEIRYKEEQASKDQFYTDILQQYDVIYEGEAKAFINEQ
ncbi:peptidyl-prolyl cis-trans isomerase [Formosa haliotis]|uniref:peptidylprolyl isomerase n=1 Tax=Formosa haliotis TaxID=1555194 RepID=UPI000824F7D8|nr:peptidylprolyl isomerase [Formosa haliotis]